VWVQITGAFVIHLLATSAGGNSKRGVADSFEGCGCLCLVLDLACGSCLRSGDQQSELGFAQRCSGPRTNHLLLVFCAQVREEYESKTVEVYAFTSAKKMASILIKRDDSTMRLYNKGAAEWVLKRCVSLHNEYGEVVPMTEAIREDLLQVSHSSCAVWTGLEHTSPRMDGWTCVSQACVHRL
jgi:hypothetical protein